MSPYEQDALLAIHQWKHPELNWLRRAFGAVNGGIEAIGERAIELPGIEWVVDNAVVGALRAVNEASLRTVRPAAILKDYRGRVSTLAQIQQLDLAQVDDAIGWLGPKYRGLAAAEGAATGALGLVGIPADVAGILTINLRAIGEYATYCGFDVSRPEERLFALHTLGLATTPTNAAKLIALSQLTKIAVDVARKRAMREIEEHVFVAVVKVICRALAIRLTRVKLAQVVPAAGAVIGGSYNQLYASTVTKAAFMLYRERFLAAKYGAGILGDD